LQFLRIASDFACNLQGAKCLLAPVLSYSLACLPQLGLLNTMAWATSPPLFSSTLIISYVRPAHSSHLAIIHAAGINLTTTLINIVLVASYLMSSMPPASSFHQHCTHHVLMSSTPLASSFHRHRTHRVLMSSTPPASSFQRYHTCRVASYCTTSHCPGECCAKNSRSSLIFSLHHICYHPCHQHPQCHPNRHRTHHIASYCTTSHCPCECCANNSRSSLVFTPCHSCYRPCCHRQPHRHPHLHRTHHVLMSFMTPASSSHRHRTCRILMSSTPPASSFHQHRTLRFVLYNFPLSLSELG